jgi:hypothetical protein
MENREELTHFELEMYVGPSKSEQIIKEANGRKIFFENTLDDIDGYIITYE